jgi:hypothetical protein
MYTNAPCSSLPRLVPRPTPNWHPRHLRELDGIARIAVIRRARVEMFFVLRMILANVVQRRATGSRRTMARKVTSGHLGRRSTLRRESQ